MLHAAAVTQFVVRCDLPALAHDGSIIPLHRMRVCFPQSDCLRLDPIRALIGAEFELESAGDQMALKMAKTQTRNQLRFI